MHDRQNTHVTLLLQQGRLSEAEAALRNVLSETPDDFEALLLLAITMAVPGRKTRYSEALEAVESALRVEPESDRAHAWRARILAGLKRRPEALASASKALDLDPEDPFNWVTIGDIHTQSRDWREAEQCALRALELDPNDTGAQDLLSRSLLIQGRLEENDSQIAARLAENPEDSVVRCNAGFAALRKGDHRAASEHFAAALQVDPECEISRDGLIESFRSRSAFYRWYLAASFRIAAVSERYGMWLFIGLYVVYRIVFSATRAIDPRIGYTVAALYLSFVFWSYVARGLSTFFLLADRFARMALRGREKLEAVVVGGGFSAGLVTFILGLVVFGSDRVAFTGAALLAQSIPASLLFSADSRTGRLVYGSASVAVWSCAAVALFSQWTGLLPGLGTAVTTLGLATAVGCTFLALFGVGRR